LKKSWLPGFIAAYRKCRSLLLATWNGGAPNAIVKKMIPREKISAVYPLKGTVLAL